MPIFKGRTAQRSGKTHRLARTAGTSQDGSEDRPRSGNRITLYPLIQRQCDDMDWNELRDVCLTFPGSEETFPFGFETSVFKVAGKMFALSRGSAQPLQVSLKCEPVLAEQLRAAHSAVAPGYHLNKRHWNTVTLDGSLTDSMIAELIEDSYDLVVSGLPKTHQRALRWRPEPT
jgi:predicted DNA-binding protein (MmcQ/YjbR family)